MKTFTTLIIFCFIFLFYGCKKQHNEKTNYFNLNGKEFQINNGFYIIMGSEIVEKKQYHLFFTTEEIKWNEVINALTGEGNIISLNLYLSTQDGIVNGTYSFKFPQNIYGEIGDFYTATCCQNVSYIDRYGSGGQCNYTGSSDSGQVMIVKSGSNYDIQFEVTLENKANHLMGRYTAPLRDDIHF